MTNDELLDKMDAEGKLRQGGGYVFSYSDMEEAMDKARKDEAVEFVKYIHGKQMTMRQPFIRLGL